MNENQKLNAIDDARSLAKPMVRGLENAGLRDLAMQALALLAALDAAHADELRKLEAA